MRKDIQNTAEIKRIEEIKKTTEIIKVNEACLDWSGRPAGAGC